MVTQNRTRPHSAQDILPETVKYFKFLLKYEVRELFFFVYGPVCKKGTDEVFGISRHFYIIREDERVLVVHNLPVGSDQGLGIEGSLTCRKKVVLYSD